MATSTVLGLVGGVLILVGLIGGGFSFSGTMMPAVGKVVRIPCFIIGGILVISAITLAFRENPLSSNQQASASASDSAVAVAAGIVQVASGGDAYIYEFPSTGAPTVGQLTNGAGVTILCTVQGTTVQRSDGVTSSLWDRIDQGYIPDVNVYTGTDQPVTPGCP